ncbi:MAG: response regulator [SAR324 cluster bacterium]|nr:response regulator [SAR324 cluster bacterium]
MPPMLEERNVLIVDDSAQLRKILSKIVRDAGCTSIRQAGDGIQALAELKESKFKNAPVDLILLDWNMPNMSGLEFLKKIRENPDHKETSVIMITAEAQRENIIDAVKAGVNSYIVKPFSEETVLGKLKSLIASENKQKNKQ